MAPSRLKKSKQKAAERLDLLSSIEMTITIFIICIYYMPFEMYEKDGILRLLRRNVSHHNILKFLYFKIEVSFVFQNCDKMLIVCMQVLYYQSKSLRLYQLKF